MAHKYVWHAAAGAADGSSWANAYTTVKAAVEAAGTVLNDNVWVAHDHDETLGAAISITHKGGIVACANRAGSVPPVEADLRTTAKITTTGAFGITIGGPICGEVLFYGIILAAGTGATNAGLVLNGISAFCAIHYVNCKFRKLGTVANGAAICTNTAISRGITTFDNCTMEFGATGDLFNPQGEVIWRNTPSAIVGAIIPTVLIQNSPSSMIRLTCDAVDFSALGAGTLVNGSGSATFVDFINCKLGASAVIMSNQFGIVQSVVTLINCDSGGTNVRTEKHLNSVGSQVIETTVVRTGGASDGATPIAWKIVTQGIARSYEPFESLPIRFWNDVVGLPRSVAIYGTWGGGAVPTNADIWIEVEYPGSAASPQASFVSNGPVSFLGVGVNQAADTTSVWGGGTTKFKMVSPSFVPMMKGLITVRIKAAKPSSTFYTDPKLEVL